MHGLTSKVAAPPVTPLITANDFRTERYGYLHRRDRKGVPDGRQLVGAIVCSIFSDDCPVSGGTGESISCLSLREMNPDIIIYFVLLSASTFGLSLSSSNCISGSAKHLVVS